MTDELLPRLEIGPRGNATHVVFWLHGLGDTGHGHEDVVRALPLPAEARVRFVLPHAPRRAVTVNMGMIMPAWYDVEQIGRADRHDLPGIRRSAADLEALVAHEIARGVQPQNIVLAGFSQGGVVALDLALRYPERLAGTIGLSTYVVAGDTPEEDVSPANRDLPVFLGHGTQDPMVPLEAMHKSRDMLTRLGHPVTWREYPMEHAICPEEIRDVGAWLAEQLR